VRLTFRPGIIAGVLIPWLQSEDIAMMVRSCIIVASACLLFAAGPTTAQAPPEPNLEQRLRALEEKMDRVLKVLEVRADQQPMPPVDAATRDRLRTDLAAKVKEHREFRRKNPLLLFRDDKGASSTFVDRLAKIEAQRAEMKIKKSELEAQLALVVKAMGIKGSDFGRGNDEFEKQILQLKLSRQRMLSTYGDNHPAVKEIDQTIELARQIYGGKTDRTRNTVQFSSDEIQAEIAGCTAALRMLDQMFDQESKLARELSALQVRDDEFRSEIDRLRQALADADKSRPADPAK
jgi:hypothetical protein